MENDTQTGSVVADAITQSATASGSRRRTSGLMSQDESRIKGDYERDISEIESYLSQINDTIREERSPMEDPLRPRSSSGVSLRPKLRPGSDIYKGLVDRGMPEHIAEGFVMNFRDESGFDSGVNEENPLVEGSRGGFGLYQLTGPRRVEYESYAKERGVTADNMDAQLDFLMLELKGAEKSAAKKIYSTGTSGEAGAAVVNYFLRPAKKYRASRANKYLTQGL